MLQTPSLQSLISWSENGKVFSVSNPTEFSRSVLPNFYKHNNFQSFVRQLNMYGFHKVNDIFSTGPTLASTASDGVVPWEFQHTSFQRDRPELLPLVKRKSSKNSGTSQPVQKSTSNSGGSSRASSEQPQNDPPSSGGRAPGGGQSGSGYGGGSSGGGGYGSRHQSSDYRSGGRDHGGMSDLAGVSPIVNDPYYSSSNAYSQPIPSTYSSRPGNSSYYRPRSATSDEAFSRQISGLEGQVRSLSDALHASQQESMMGRAATSSILRMLVNLIATLDPNGERRNDIEVVQNAITKLSPDVGFSPASYQPKTFGSSVSGSNPNNAPWYSVAPSSSNRPPSSSTQVPYQRVPAPAESFTRGGRPDSDDPLFQSYSHFPLSNADQYPTSSYQGQGGSTQSPSGYVLPLPRPSSSGYQTAYSTAPTSNRTSWQTPPSTGGSRADTLPPLSSLLSGGDHMRRSNEEGGDGGDRKKQRR